MPALSDFAALRTCWSSRACSPSLSSARDDGSRRCQSCCSVPKWRSVEIGGLASCNTLGSWARGLARTPVCSLQSVAARREQLSAHPLASLLVRLPRKPPLHPALYQQLALSAQSLAAQCPSPATAWATAWKSASAIPMETDFPPNNPPTILRGGPYLETTARI